MKITVKVDNQSYDVNIGDLNSRPIIATIDGQTFEVYPEEALRVAPVVVSAPSVATPAPVTISSTVLAAPAAAPAVSGAASGLKAPIPGVIITVTVKEGDQVKKGQELCVLEAMKMKNSLKSSRDGKVISVKAKVGEHVQKDALLIEIGD